MEDVEQKALSSYPSPPSFWKRYVDDTLTALPQDQVQCFHEHLNSIEPTIQFTIEMESTGTLPFLDTRITHHSDGSLSSTVFRKSTHTDKYLDFVTSPPGAQGGSGPNSVQPCWKDLHRCPRHREGEGACCKGPPKQRVSQRTGHPHRSYHHLSRTHPQLRWHSPTSANCRRQFGGSWPHLGFALVSGHTIPWGRH